MNPQVVHQDVSKPARGCQNKCECVCERERVMAGVCVCYSEREKTDKNCKKYDDLSSGNLKYSRSTQENQQQTIM